MSDAQAVISQGTGEPLILLHGLGYNAEYWRLQINAFAPHYRVIAWNMPGYSGTKPLDSMTFKALSDALAAELDSLGIDRAHILGHSMGGMLALEFTANHPERVKSLILFGASAAFPPADSDFAKAFVADRLGPLEAGGNMADVAQEMKQDHFGPDADREGVTISDISISVCPVDTYRRSLDCLVHFDRRDALGNIAVPTLVIAAEKDINAPAKGVEKMAAKIPGALYICLRGVGHLANLEQPKAFNQVVLEFLQQQK